MAKRYMDLARGLNFEIGRKHWETIRANSHMLLKKYNFLDQHLFHRPSWRMLGWLCISHAN